MEILFWGTAKALIYSFLTGIIILFIGFGVGFLAKKLLKSILQEIELNRIASKIGISFNLESALSNLLLFLIYLATFFFFFRQLGISSLVFYVIFGIIFVLLILAFFVGLKSLVPNLLAGINLKKNGKVEEGRKIEINGIKGTVEKAGLLEVLIETEKKDLLHVPYLILKKS